MENGIFFNIGTVSSYFNWHPSLGLPRPWFMDHETHLRSWTVSHDDNTKPISDGILMNYNIFILSMAGKLMKILKLRILQNQEMNATNCLVMMHGASARFRFYYSHFMLFHTVLGRNLGPYFNYDTCHYKHLTNACKPFLEYGSTYRYSIRKRRYLWEDWSSCRSRLFRIGFLKRFRMKIFLTEWIDRQWRFVTIRRI